jgi:hypothetical protein
MKKFFYLKRFTMGNKKDRRCESSSESSSVCHKQKVCFGYWGVPRPLKCGVPCQYDQFKFCEIPTGSIYFAQRWDAYGAMRSLASSQRWSNVGIIFQVGSKSRGERFPAVLTVQYNGRVEFTPLRTLVEDPLVIVQGVRVRQRAHDHCTENELCQYLFRIAKRYLGAPFETNGAQVARSIFDIPAINPSEDSFTDTELVYRVLFEAALLGDCCPPDEIKDFPIQKCCDKSSFSISSSDACKKSCCSSSESSASCNDCQKVDLYRASAVSVCDFITADYLDMRWYYPIASIYTEPMDACRRDLAITQSFGEQGPCLLRDMRQLVTLWQSGFSFPDFKTNKCDPCKPILLTCGGKKKQEHCDSESSSSEDAEHCKTAKECKYSRQEVIATMANLQSAVNQLLKHDGQTQGDLLFQYFQSVMDFLACLIDSKSPQLHPTCGGEFCVKFCLSPLKKPDCKADCEESSSSSAVCSSSSSEECEASSSSSSSHEKPKSSASCSSSSSSSGSSGSSSSSSTSCAPCDESNLAGMIQTLNNGQW